MALAIGSHTITATYGGDGNFSGSSGIFTLTVTVYTPGSFYVGVQNDNGSGDAIANCASADNSDCTLSSAIQAANNAGPGPHIITLKNNVTLTGRMRRLIEQNMTIRADVSPRTVSCSSGSGGQPFFIGGGLAGSTVSNVAYPTLNNLNVTLKGLSISGCMAKGGDSGLGGGAGAGLGGALFVYGGNVSLEDMTFYGNRAQGGEPQRQASLGVAGCTAMELSQAPFLAGAVSGLVRPITSAPVAVLAITPAVPLPCSAGAAHRPVSAGGVMAAELAQTEAVPFLALPAL